MFGCYYEHDCGAWNAPYLATWLPGYLATWLEKQNISVR